MKHLVVGLVSLASLVAISGTAAAQSGRDGLVLGKWECNAQLASGEATPINHVTVQFNPDRTMAFAFFGGSQDVSMTFTVGGAWAYDANSDTFSESFNSARIDNIVVRGEPLPRSQYPGGEAALAQSEQQFLDQYSNAPLSFTTVSSSALVLTDTQGATINCAR